jgi:hypothetical protein
VKVWLVGILNVELTETRYVCFSKETALKRWEEIRQELIERNKEVWERHDHEMYARQNRNLQQINPILMDNYPYEEPFIREMETEE